ncbi:MAG: fumarate hydratase [Candidatus Kariarchaeaceae archaeon]|jgi:fumarate hydratase subunit alpha
MEIMQFDKVIEDAGVELLRLSATKLPSDVFNSMEKIKRETTHEGAVYQITNIVKDAAIARDQSRPMCQDTGIVAWDLKIGDDFPLKSKLKDILKESVKRATNEVPLRPNTVDLLDGNPGNNIGPRGYLPYFYVDVVPGDKLKITAITKGGGSSNIAKLGMLKPGLGLKGALKFAIDAVAEAGPQGCPPYRLGIGIGGGEDICMTLAKKAILKPIGARHSDERIAKLEDAVFEAVNKLPIGPMGVGAGDTVIDVNINIAARHPASLPVGIVMSCCALRHASATISADGSVEYTEY